MRHSAPWQAAGPSWTVSTRVTGRVPRQPVTLIASAQAPPRQLYVSGTTGALQRDVPPEPATEQ
ncbi:hypothetical protein HD597_000374 [Nonomuraea thailandensis]|uniref:Uncharacterized protein n=1 Tax=Nonomuraea thailandensis TaxID=1188745 RepID=A0A9X2G697_9ACTN|nr:hypothetical protein [Nonomuraea thailandensis]MCP2353354.1 hypothetical protein [Nonomuraea thailandensis]